MKQIINTFLIALLIAFFISALLLRIDNSAMADYINELREQDAERQATIDSLWTAFRESEMKKDTIYVELIRWRTRYDTIYKVIPLMPPTEQLAMFDTYTGEHLPSALSPELFAMVPMPRIERALVLFTERDQLAGEVQILSRVISTQEGQIVTLNAIIDQKDGQLRIRDAWIESYGKENVVLRRRLAITQWTAGVIIGLLIIVSLN